MRNILKTAGVVLSVTSVCLTLQSQELSGNITIRGEYTPQVRKHSRPAVSPGHVPLSLPPAELPVCTQGVLTELAPVGVPTLALSGDADPGHIYRGYMQLDMGSWLNTNLSAGYRVLNDSVSEAGVWLQHNSTSLYRPESAMDQSNDWLPERRYRYDERIGVYGSHRMGRAGTLAGSVTYHLGEFNYYSDRYNPNFPAYSRAPGQTLNDLAVQAGWRGRRKADGGFWADGDVSYRLFAFSHYNPTADEDLRGSVEHNLTLRGVAGYGFDPAKGLKLDVSWDMLAYNREHVYREQSDNSTFRFTPGFYLNTGGLSMRAGVVMNVTPRVKRWDFDIFHAAPDVAVSFATGSWTLFASATGGVSPVSAAGMHEVDYYFSPLLPVLEPVYTPLNASVGIKAEAQGLHAGASFRYAVSKNIPVTGLYPYTVHGCDPFGRTGIGWPKAMDVHGFSLQGECGYALAGLLEVNGALTYQPQHGRRGWYNSMDRPRWTVDLEGTVRPLEGLKLSVGYNYKGVRTLYLGNDLHNPGNWVGVRLPDIYNLNFSVAYTLRERFTFSIAVDNLLNCDDRTIPIMPTEGLTVTGGVALLF